jgi:hypothetical protein
VLGREACKLFKKTVISHVDSYAETNLQSPSSLEC